MPGSGANGTHPRADGAFTGTTDEILQWVACKWGVDEDLVRAQVAVESWWRQGTRGDVTTVPDHCHPTLRSGATTCPESIGLMQVKYRYHGSAYVGGDAIRSSAANVDYAFAAWRACFDGTMTWLNTVERGAHYAAGDALGCMGVWYAGRWRTPSAERYIAEVQRFHDERIWEHPDFRSG